MEYPMFHHFASDISNIPLPDRFTYPFCYVPHPLCTVAAYEVQEHLRQYDKGYGTEEGKMFGVLAVRTAEGDVGYLAAFSGIWHGSNRHPFFVPPVYDLLSPEGFFRQEEKEISHLNVCIHALENNPQYTTLKQLADDTAKSARASLEQARIRLKEAKATRDLRRQSTLSPEEEEQLKNESRFQKAELKRMERQWKVRTDAIEAQLHSYKEEEARLKAERKRRSAALQTKLFRQFVLLNAKGEHIRPYPARYASGRSRRVRGSQTAPASLPARVATAVHGRILVGTVAGKRSQATRALLSGVQRQVRPHTKPYAARSESGSQSAGPDRCLRNRHPV